MATDLPPQSGTSATDELVLQHLPLVGYGVAELNPRVPRHVPRDDLLSAGMLGLIQAARSFDPARGIGFDRYAMIRIRGALLDELRSRDWATRSVRAMARRMEATAVELAASTGAAPSLADTASAMGVTADSLAKVVDDVHRATVLNFESILADSNLADLMPDSDAAPDDAMLLREQRAYLRDAIVALPERLRRVVVAYYYEERSLKDIGAEIGVSESRVSQMRAEALELLRLGMTAHLEPEALPEQRKPTGPVARRRAAYCADVGSASDFRARLSNRPVPIPSRVAALSA